MAGNSDGVLSRIGVLMLGVTDMGRSLAFYRDKLGLSLRGAGGEFAFLDAGGVMLALRESPELGPPPAEEWVEVVFSVEDIVSTYDSLRARGVEFRREPRLVTGDQHAADFRDPDGHVLSIFGPRSAS
jgi:catechol 2,3-dioxygenase-like lactoylglutathione lyase family enzyme